MKQLTLLKGANETTYYFGLGGKILMGHKWLSYLLIVMIAMQSVLAMAEDIHQSHQDGIQHLEFQHEHDPKALNKIPDMEKAPYALSGENMIAITVVIVTICLISV